MRRSDLKNVYYLSKEIDLERGRYNELINKIKDKDDEKLKRLTDDIKTITNKYIFEYNRIYNWICFISDPLIRQIFKLRYLDLCSWAKISYIIGGNNTPDSVRKMHDRYLKGCELRINSREKGTEND